MAWYEEGAKKAEEQSKAMELPELAGTEKQEKRALKIWLEEEVKKAEEQSKAMELPELVGTEKQVKWALKIRLDAIKAMEKQIEAQKALERQNPKGEHEREKYLMILGFNDILKNETKASWWIDNRYMCFGVIAIQRGKKVVNELVKKES